MEVAGIGQRASVAAPLACKAQLVATLDLLRQHPEPDPAHAALGIGETAVHHLGSEPHRLEDLRPLVGLQRRDAHLGHHLEDALADPLAVRGDHVVVGSDVVEVVHPPGAPDVPEAFVGEIGIDGVRPVAQQQAVVVHFARFAGLDDKGDAGALMRAHQVVVHAAHGKQGADCEAVRADPAVREDEHPVSFLHRPVGLPFEAGEGGEQTPLSGAPREGGVESPASPAVVGQVRQGCELPVGEDRVGQAQPVRVLLRDLEQVALGPDVALERHDHFLADRIDGGVGHLREALLEVVVEHARPVRERRQFRVVAHGPERVAPVAHQAEEHELHGLGGIAESPHAPENGRFVVAVRIGGLFQFQALPREPLPVGPPLRPFRLDLVVGHQPSRIEVDQEEPPRM